KAQPKTAKGIDVEKLLPSHGALATLFGLLHERTGVDFSFYKQSTLKRRILRRMVLKRIDSLPKFVRLVEHSPDEMNSLFNDLLINVSGFFRDPKSFARLKQRIFPRLLKAHPGNTPWRFWVCGCASGEEAYSLAICV